MRLLLFIACLLFLASCEKHETSPLSGDMEAAVAQVLGQEAKPAQGIVVEKDPIPHLREFIKPPPSPSTPEALKGQSI